MKNLYYISLIFLVLTSCSPKLSSTWTFMDYQGKAYSKVAVVGISKDLTARNEFEQNAVELLKNHGVNAIEGITIFPPNSAINKEDDEKIIKILKDNKVDAVITISLINTSESQHYVPGETYQIPMGLRRFGRYYYRTYSYISTDGYYQDGKSYLIESALYDVAVELENGQNSMVWSGQSTLVNPFSKQDAAKDFTKKMVKSLITENIILGTTNIR